MIEWDVFEDLKSWMKDLRQQQNYSERTIDAYWSDVHTCLKFLASRGGNSLSRDSLQQMTTQDFRSWLDYRKEKGYGIRSTVRAFSIMKQFCKFLVNSNVLPSNPLLKLKAPSVVPREPIQRNCLILRDKIMRHLILEDGVSITEIFALNKGDVVLSPPMLALTDRRKRKRYVSISADFLSNIQLYLNLLPFPFTQDTPLFVGPRGKRLTPAFIRKLASLDEIDEQMYA